MQSSPTRRQAVVAAAVFGIVPCLLGIGIGQILKWSDIVWLTDAGWFWPGALLLLAVAALARRAISPFSDGTLSVSAWLVIVIAWMYVPLWLTATGIPPTSAVVSREGRVVMAREEPRQPVNHQPAGDVWLLTRNAGTKVVHNVWGTATISAVESKFRFAEPYIATRKHDEDLSSMLIGAVSAALATEAGKPRTERVELFAKGKANTQLLERICRDAARDSPTCPLRLTLTPQPESTALGEVWSKSFTEAEAVQERHLPTLVQLLTDDQSRLVDRERVFALFLELADSVEPLFRAALKPRMLDERQLDTVIARLIAAPGGGDEAVRLVIEASALKPAQREALRAKALEGASLEFLLRHAQPFRLSDADVARLSARFGAAFDKSPGLALLALETLGERLPLQTQQEAVAAILRAKVSYALAALRHLNFSAPLRENVFRKVLAEASYDDFDAAHLAREKLEDTLTPREMRTLSASVIERSGSSAKWLEFAVRALPLRALTASERRSVLDELLFASTKTAFEFVSENRHYFEAAEVNEVTVGYTRTIAHDMCLHLSHRNKNRKTNFFSQDQLRILTECAQEK